MCGVFGWSLHEPPDKRTRGRLAYLGMSLTIDMDQRGGDGWGYIGDGKITRGLGAMSENVDPADIAQCQTLMAHTRWATHGAKSLENVHPFEVENIVGAHNGIIFNHAELNKKYERKHTVDSMNLFEHLARGMPLDELHGYGTVEWITRPEWTRVNLVRFNTTDLHVHTLKGIGVVWASTRAAVEGAVRLAGLDSSAFIIKERKLYHVALGQLRSSKRMLNFAGGMTRSEYIMAKWWNNRDDMEDWDVYTGGAHGSTSVKVIDHRRVKLTNLNGDTPAKNECVCGNPTCTLQKYHEALRCEPTGTCVGNIVRRTMQETARIEHESGAVVLPNGLRLAADGGKYD